MDKKESMRLFIKHNSSLFKEDPFPRRVYKKVKHQFFIERIKGPVPKDSEIAGDIVEGMILSAQLKTEDELQKLLELPFFKDALQNKQYYYERLAFKSKQPIPFLDLAAVKKAEEMEKFRTLLKEEVRQEMVEQKEVELKEWDDKINEKAEMYFSFPSILDKEEYPLPDISEEVTENDGLYLPWWEKLGLIEDPFKELDGLTDIKNLYYSKIIHKTPIFLRYETFLQNSISELFRNSVIIGQFGSGKTTLFDYLLPILSEKKVFPIYIQLTRGLEVHALIFEFQKKVSIELWKLFSVLVGENVTLQEAASDQEALVKLMKKIMFRGANGFLIIVDDLHKGDLNDAMDFMSYLQVLASQFRRGTELKIGFIVAGSLEWEEKLNNDEKFSGSVNRQEHMPLIDIDVALDAINKRLEAFSRNPENPRRIERSFVERIFNRLTYNNEAHKITFRKIMVELLKEFNDGHFTALSANPIKLSQETKNGIQLLLNKHAVAKMQIEDFFNSSKDMAANQRRRCLELLVKVYVLNGLIESEIREPEAPFLQRLSKSGLIIKVASREKLSWKISRELYSANKEIIRSYKLSMEDYLFQLYVAQLPVKKESQSHNEETFQIDKILKSMPLDIGYDFLNEAKHLHNKVLENKSIVTSDEGAKILVTNCTNSLAKLTCAYMVFAREEIPNVRDGINVLNFWTDFWWGPEPIFQYLRAVQSDFQNKIPLIKTLYRESFSLILNFYKNESENSAIFYIPPSLLKAEEIKLLHDARRLISENCYEEAISLVAKNVDQKLRTFLHDIFTLLYGNLENRVKWLDRTTQLQIQLSAKASLPTGFSALRNEFLAINSVDYRHIMTGLDNSNNGRRNWRCIFSTAFNYWQEGELHYYLGILEEPKNRIGAMADIEVLGSRMDYALKFIKLSIKLMRSINLTYLKLLTANFGLSNNYGTFSLCAFSDRETLMPIQIEQEDIERVVSLFENNKKLRISLDNQEYLEGFFGMDYRKAYALLATVIRGVKKEQYTVKLELMNAKSPDVYIRLVKTG